MPSVQRCLTGSQEEGGCLPCIQGCLKGSREKEGCLPPGRGVSIGVQGGGGSCFYRDSRRKGGRLPCIQGRSWRFIVGGLTRTSGVLILQMGKT